MAEDARFLTRAEAALTGAGVAPVRRLGRTLMANLEPGTELVVSPGKLELTVAKRHQGGGASEVEQAIRTRLGTRLEKRGWQETMSDTAESTLPDADVDGEMALVTEMVWRREIAIDEVVEEIRWLVARVRG